MLYRCRSLLSATVEAPFPCFPTETLYVEDKLRGTGLVEVAQG